MRLSYADAVFTGPALNRVLKDYGSARRLKAVLSTIASTHRSYPVLRPRAYLAVLTCSFTACTTTSTHSPAYQPLNDGLSGYLECLNAAVYRIDDGKRDVSSVAHAVKEICAQEFAKGQSATLDPATRRIYEQRSEARQLELSDGCPGCARPALAILLRVVRSASAKRVTKNFNLDAAK